MRFGAAGFISPGAQAAIDANKVVGPQIAAVQADPTLTAEQKKAKIDALYKAGQAIVIAQTMTKTSTATSATPAVVNTSTGALPPSGDLLPLTPLPSSNFFTEHATALKITGGVALAGVVGYFVWRRYSRR